MISAIPNHLQVLTSVISINLFLRTLQTKCFRNCISSLVLEIWGTWRKAMTLDQRDLVLSPALTSWVTLSNVCLVCKHGTNGIYPQDCCEDRMRLRTQACTYKQSNVLGSHTDYILSHFEGNPYSICLVNHFKGTGKKKRLHEPCFSAIVLDPIECHRIYVTEGWGRCRKNSVSVRWAPSALPVSCLWAWGNVCQVCVWIPPDPAPHASPEHCLWAWLMSGSMHMALPHEDPWCHEWYV